MKDLSGQTLLWDQGDLRLVMVGALLAQTYKEMGVSMVWQLPNRMLGGLSPAARWREDPESVEDWAESLTGMVAT